MPPIPYTFVINIGKGASLVNHFLMISSKCLMLHGCQALETATKGLTRATSHRVLSPAKGSTPRYSIPFFQNIGQRVKLSESALQCA